LGGNTAVKAVTGRKMEQFTSACRERGMKSHSIKCCLRRLLTAFDTSLEWGWIDKPLEIKRAETPQKPPRIISPEEI